MRNDDFETDVEKVFAEIEKQEKEIIQILIEREVNFTPEMLKGLAHQELTSKLKNDSLGKDEEKLAQAISIFIEKSQNEIFNEEIKNKNGGI